MRLHSKGGEVVVIVAVSSQGEKSVGCHFENERDQY